MGATTLVSLSEYLSTTYRPDCDFLEGELLERNLGEQPHARIQGYFSFVFRSHQQDWQLRALAEQRVQVRAERYRIADIAVIRLSDPDDRILRKPPLICIEVQSSTDTLTSVQNRVDDYASMGVENIWVVDPWKRLGYYASTAGCVQPEDGVLRVPGTQVAVPLADLFAEL